jgi:hypothetical protein
MGSPAFLCPTTPSTDVPFLRSFTYDPPVSPGCYTSGHVAAQDFLPDASDIGGGPASGPHGVAARGEERMEIAGLLEKYLQIHGIRLMVDDPATGFKELAARDFAKGFHHALLGVGDPSDRYASAQGGDEARPVAVPAGLVDDRRMAAAGDTPPETWEGAAWVIKPLATDFILGNGGGTARRERFVLLRLFLSCILTRSDFILTFPDRLRSTQRQNKQVSWECRVQSASRCAEGDVSCEQERPKVGNH